MNGQLRRITKDGRPGKRLFKDVLPKNICQRCAVKCLKISITDMTRYELGCVDESDSKKGIRGKVVE